MKLLMILKKIYAKIKTDIGFIIAFQFSGSKLMITCRMNGFSIIGVDSEQCCSFLK
jgi:hypothetical protein